MSYRNYAWTATAASMVVVDRMKATGFARGWQEVGSGMRIANDTPHGRRGYVAPVAPGVPWAHVDRRGRDGAHRRSERPAAVAVPKPVASALGADGRRSVPEVVADAGWVNVMATGPAIVVSAMCPNDHTYFEATLRETSDAPEIPTQCMYCDTLDHFTPYLTVRRIEPQRRLVGYVVKNTETGFRRGVQCCKAQGLYDLKFARMLKPENPYKLFALYVPKKASYG